MDNVIVIDKLDDLSNITYNMNSTVQNSLWPTTNQINQNTAAIREYLFNVNLYQPIAKVSNDDSNNQILLEFNGLRGIGTNYIDKTIGIIEVPIGGTYTVNYDISHDNSDYLLKSYISLYEILAIDSSTNYINTRASTDFTTWSRNYSSYRINNGSSNVTIRKGKYKVKLGFIETIGTNVAVSCIRFIGYYDIANINQHPDYVYTITNASISNQQ